VRSNETVTPLVLSHRFWEGELAAKTAPLKVPGALTLLSASATYAGAVVLVVAIAHATSVENPAVSQFGSVLGSVALPTVIANDTVDVS
jgi:hypothetical protein